MEPNAPPLSGEAASPVPAAGELVVQNGRFAGTCRLLSASLNLIGRSPGCEIRLNVDDVAPLHCAILQTPGGLVLRDLDSGPGTFVNGQRVTACLLADGDLLRVGPFEFRVHWQSPGGGASPCPSPPRGKQRRKPSASRRRPWRLSRPRCSRRKAASSSAAPPWRNRSSNWLHTSRSDAEDSSPRRTKCAASKRNCN